MQQEQFAILAQKLSEMTAGTRLRRLAFIAILPFFGAVAAFGIAPDTVTEPVAVTQVTEELPLPALPVMATGNERYWHEEIIVRGDTVASIIARLHVEDPQAVRALLARREAKALYQLAPGKSIRAQVGTDGKLYALQYLKNGSLFSVERTGDDLDISERPAQLDTQTLMASGEIRSSLFAATDQLQLSDSVAIQVADIFSSDIDFHRDLRKGDRFTIVYEAHFHQGVMVKTGRVAAAEFINQGRAFRAVYFENAEGRGGYYTPEGKNIRKQFLRSPLEFSRISSGFSHSRFHPVLKQWRAHRGIDYAAPTGTRVKATADGFVQFVGTNGGYGKVVVLRHQSKYTTWYGHLSRFAKGLHKGMRVAQGDVIGYVGATGLATGPHLHYEFRINDVHQNPLRVVMPAAPPITAADKADFDLVAGPLADKLALLRGVNLARLD